MKHQVDQALLVDCGLGHGRSLKALQSEATGSFHCLEVPGLEMALWLCIDFLPLFSLSEILALILNSVFVVNQM